LRGFLRFHLEVFMAYSSLAPASRIGNLGSVGDATTRADSVKYIWGYVTADTAAVVETANYFPNSAANQYPAFTVGDRIDAIMNAGVSQTPVTKSYVVTVAPTSTTGPTIALQTTTAG
jgi:hypothetical protein